jgi:ribosome maturation protein SDO1
LQVSDKERQAQNEALFKEVATHLSEKCVNPESKRPYPVSMIEKAMKECHVALKPNKSAKQQVPDTVAKLKDHIPIERAQMRIKLTFPLTANKGVRNKLKKLLGPEVANKPEKEEREEAEVSLWWLVDPGQYRPLDELIRDETQGKGSVEIIDLKVLEETVEEEEKLGTVKKVFDNVSKGKKGAKRDDLEAKRGDDLSKAAGKTVGQVLEEETGEVEEKLGT